MMAPPAHQPLPPTVRFRQTTNNEGGDGAAIVLAKSNVPFGTSIVSQNNSERQSLEEQQVANKAPDNAQESERQEAKFQNKPKAKTAD